MKWSQDKSVTASRATADIKIRKQCQQSEETDKNNGFQFYLKMKN